MYTSDGHNPFEAAMVVTPLKRGQPLGSGYNGLSHYLRFKRRIVPCSLSHYIGTTSQCGLRQSAVWTDPTGHLLTTHPHSHQSH